jgi:ribosomal protein L14E/L6E/L27E
MFLYEFGSIAISKAGHDKGEVFVIKNSDSEYIYLMDGKNRTIKEPKKKNIKHVQCVHYTDKILLEKHLGQEKIINEDVKRAIKLYKSKNAVNVSM